MVKDDKHKYFGEAARTKRSTFCRPVPQTRSMANSAEQSSEKQFLSHIAPYVSIFFLNFDLQKVSDSLNWSCLVTMLRSFGFVDFYQLFPNHVQTTKILDHYQ